ncbi:hypothetical protein AB0F30_32640 [Streptomyces sp. NPDC029006]|uniref:hypothetical protein n=1 Tax=Streptomyces sp. NPDC029006 TaxID=3155467 RepID=UPI0033CD6DCA
MANGDTTPEQRLEKLRGLLMGTRSDSRVVRALGQGDKGNVLFGAALHAADRLRVGQAPTDLEQKALGVLRAALSDAEIKQWGQVYREAVTQLGRLAVVPEVITRRPVTSGYTTANLKADFGPVAAEHMARANSQVVDREVLAAGRDFDSPSFLAGVRGAGFGVTVFDAAPPSAPAAGTAEAEAGAEPGEEVLATPAPFRAKLELESFYVERAVGDQGGGRDEIYWCTSSTSDKVSGPGYKSQEFGAVKKGDTRTFSTSNRTIFDGQVGNAMILSMYCWEADQSTSDWYDRLQTAMNQLSKHLFDTWQWQIMSQFIPVGIKVGIALDLAIFFTSIVEHLRNEDDLSCERVLVLDRFDLALLAHQGSTNLHFNGDGYHVLKMKYSGDKVPFPTGQLEYAVYQGTAWGKPLTLPWESITPPALASYGGKLYAVWARPGDQKVMWSRLEGTTWRTPAAIGTDQTVHQPALAVAHGKLYYAVTGNNNNLYWRTFNGTTWSPVTKLSNYVTNLGPSLAPEYKDRVWLTQIATNRVPYLNTHDDRQWSQAYEDNINWRTERPVAVCPFDGYLWRAAAGTDRFVYYSVASGGAEWSDRSRIHSWQTNHTPALTAFENKLWMFLRGNDGNLYVGTLPQAPHNWSTAAIVGGSQPLKLMDAPSAAAHNIKLYVMYRRPAS